MSIDRNVQMSHTVGEKYDLIMKVSYVTKNAHTKSEASILSFITGINTKMTIMN
jgi:hypothetical protein